MSVIKKEIQELEHMSSDMVSLRFSRRSELALRSLVSRVCEVDGALILSTTQATLVEQINSFLGLETDQFEAL